MNDFFYSPTFGALLTVILYILGDMIAKKIDKPFVNKLMIGIIIGVLFMNITKIPYEAYEVGAKYILFFLSPVVVMLAVPLYKNYKIISDHRIIYLSGCVFTFVINFVSIYIILEFFDLPKSLAVPMYTKSITGAMAMEVNKLLGTDVNIAAMMVSMAGLTCGFFGGTLTKIFKIKSFLAKGIGYGGICHFTGTSMALELEGETVSAIASTTMIVNGVITVILLPIMLRILL